MLMHYHGTPTVGDVFAFAAGALSGYALLGAVAHRLASGAAPISDGSHRVTVGMLHWLAVGAAIGTAALLAGVRSWLAWPLTSLCTTILYLSLTSAQLAFVIGRIRRAGVATRG